MAIFQIKKSTNEAYYFNLLATGDKAVILRSELYNTKAGCKTGIASVQANASSDSRYDRLVATNAQYYFNLKAGNGEIIGTSLMYATSTARDQVIELVKAQAPFADTEDLS